MCTALLYGSLVLPLLTTTMSGQQLFVLNPSFICTVCTVYGAFLCALCFASEGPLGPVEPCFVLVTSYDRTIMAVYKWL